MLTIYGAYRSRASRVYWMAEELDLEFTSVPVIQARRLSDPLALDAAINTHSPAFLAINPMGKIPCIKDGDFMMHESLAITLYLARKSGRFAGQTLEEENLVTMWSMWAATEVEPDAVRIVLTYDKGMETASEGKEAIAASVRKLKAPLSVLNQHLVQRDWLVGDGFTAADLNLAEVLRYTQTEEALFSANPNVATWIKRCQSRPAYLAMQAKRSQEPV